MPVRPRQVFAFSGVLNRPPGEKRDPAFLEYAVSLAAGGGKKQVCFIPTATGDSPSAIEAVTEVFDGREDIGFSVLTLFTQPSVADVRAHLTAQDVLLVGGGSVVNLMAVWRAHGLAPVMRECWQAGVVPCTSSRAPRVTASASRRTGVSAIAQSWMPPPNRYDVGFARCEVSGESAVTALDPPETSCGERSAIKRRHQWLSVPPWDWERRRYRGSNRKSSATGRCRT